MGPVINENNVDWIGRAKNLTDGLVDKWNNHTHDFKESWWRYTGEMGWNIKNIQTTGMDLGWFSWKSVLIIYLE